MVHRRARDPAKEVAGCTAVLHVESPLSPDDPGHPDAMIAVARDGATRVIEAAVAAGIGRVVMTSPANAASPTSYGDDSLTDETLWTDPDAPGLPGCRRSKTLAEQAAWSCAPCSRPLLGGDNVGSVQVIRRL
jgi:dihydroflavonol-4-reductase